MACGLEQVTKAATDFPVGHNAGVDKSAQSTALPKRTYAPHHVPRRTFCTRRLCQLGTFRTGRGRQCLR